MPSVTKIRNVVLHLIGLTCRDIIQVALSCKWNVFYAKCYIALFKVTPRNVDVLFCVY